MKKLEFGILLLLISAPLLAAPTTSVSVSHPTTTTSVQPSPRTNQIVSRPTTTGVISHPTTSVTVTHPQTVATPSKTSNTTKGSFSAIGSKSAGGSYTPSYKNAKTLTGPQTNTPKASNLGGGSNSLGLGADPNAAAKDAAASAEKPKAESSQISIDDVLKKTQIPGDLGSKIKQADFAAGKANSVGKR